MTAGSPASVVQTTRLDAAFCCHDRDPEGSEMEKQRAAVKRAAREGRTRAMATIESERVDERDGIAASVVDRADLTPRDDSPSTCLCIETGHDESKTRRRESVGETRSAQTTRKRFSRIGDA